MIYKPTGCLKLVIWKEATHSVDTPFDSSGEFDNSVPLDLIDRLELETIASPNRQLHGHAIYLVHSNLGKRPTIDSKDDSLVVKKTF